MFQSGISHPLAASDRCPIAIDRDDAKRRVYSAVVLVQDPVILDEVMAERIITAFQKQVCKGPVVLMAQDFQGTPAFYGRADIVRFLQDTDLTKLPWMDYDIADA